MRNFIIRMAVCLVLCLSALRSSAQVYFVDGREMVVDSLVVSLLTCTPGDEVYAHFGHTAIRVQLSMRGAEGDSTDLYEDDMTFNYGMFNYRSDNFIYKFVKGETDYILAVESTGRFFERYASEGMVVYEQTLSMTRDEKLKLFDLLTENSKPENRMYRYNFLYDNCTTRARDVLEAAVGGKVEYDYDVDTRDTDKARGVTSYDYTSPTLRDVLHQILSDDQWLSFGIDFVLGSEVDKEVTRRVQMFVPAFLMHYAEGATIESGGVKRPLIESENVHEPAVRCVDKAAAVSPTCVFAILLAVLALISAMQVIGIRKDSAALIALDSMLVLAQGCAGIVVAFLFFLSEHPAVGTNWLVILFNPLPILWLPWMVYRRKKGRQDRIGWVYAAVCVAFLAFMPLMPQSFGTPMYLLVMSLAVRAAANVYIVRLQEKKAALAVTHDNRQTR